MTRPPTFFSEESARHRLCASATDDTLSRATRAKSFGLSVALHGAIAGLLLFFACAMTRKPELSPRILDVVWSPDSNAAEVPASQPSVPASVAFKPLPWTPAPPIAQPDLAPSVVHEAPTSHVPSKPRHRPTSKPVTKPSSVSTAHRPVPHVNVTSALDAPNHAPHGPSASLPASAAPLTKTQQALSDAYVALLIQRLAQAHQKPSGLSDLLRATVTFHLNGDGTMTNVRITQSSGNAAFDGSVLAAFRRVQLPPPPTNLDTEDYDVTFKMKDGGE